MNADKQKRVGERFKRREWEKDSQHMIWRMAERREIQTDGQRNRPTEESSAWFTTGFIGDLRRRLGRRRPACGHKYKGESKNHYLKIY